MMTQKAIKTPYREKLDARDWEIYNERKALAAIPNSSMTAIDQKLMKKYKLKTRSAIWLIIKRVEQRGGELYYGDDDSRAE